VEAMNRDRWRRIDELVHETLELEQSQRARFLDQACLDEPEIRAEVEALVAADEQADDFLEEPAIRRRAGAGEPALDLASGDGAFEPGEGWPIGPYRVIRRLGQGGMGAVYLATRSDAEYDRAVAIKVLRPGLQSRAMVRRFRSERQILASLDHPNIARLHDGGTMPDGRPYLVMEYIDGTPIDRHAEQQGLDVRARLELFRRICDAVHYAHQNLVVHLDIKPGNILVTRDGVPKLLDFGIARLLDPDHSSQGGETHTGLRPLTPLYASPEQLRGQPLTTASDVYSLGLVLYKLLTGRLPHSRTGTEPTRPSMPRTRELPRPGRAPDASENASENASRNAAERAAENAGENDPAARAPLRRDARWRRQLAGDLDSIALKAVRDEPQHRYGSAEQLSADLDRYLSGRPVEARKGTTLYRLGKLLRRHKLAVAAAATILALVIAFAVSTAIQAARLAEERRRADQQRQNTEEVLSFLISVFQVADPFAGEGNTATAKSLLDEGARRLDQELQGQPEVQTRLRETFGSIYLSLGSYDQAATLLRQALERAERLAGPNGDELRVAAILTRLATVHLFRGEHALAEPLYARALAIRQRHLPPDHIDVAESLHNLASCYYFQNQMDRARPLYERALAISRGRAAENELETASIMSALAGVYRAQKDLARAEPLYREAVEIYEAAYGDEHPDLAYGWNNLAHVYIDMGELERAAPLLERAAQVVEKLQGAQHPQLATILYNHGLVLHRQGDLARAEQLYLRSLRILEESMGRDHPDLCDSIGRLLELYTGANRANDAEALRARFSPARLEACAAPRD
jgi:serine/threonine protein kinase/Tfp pilus assembly protein PilF